jgi:hypothetical protein
MASCTPRAAHPHPQPWHQQQQHSWCQPLAACCPQMVQDPLPLLLLLLLLLLLTLNDDVEY